MRGVQKWHCYLQLLPQLQLVQVLHRLLFLRCSRTSMPALYPRPEKSCLRWPGHWAEPNDRIWWSLGAQTEKELWLQTLGVQPHISNTLKTATALKTQKVEISKFEVTVTWTDEIFDSKRIQAMRIHITSYHYEPFKGPDGLLSPRMVSSSAFHLRPDCQCLTEKTTSPRHLPVEFSVTRSSSLGIQLEVEDISELLGRLLHLLLVLLRVRANIEYLCYKAKELSSNKNQSYFGYLGICAIRNMTKGTTSSSTGPAAGFQAASNLHMGQTVRPCSAVSTPSCPGSVSWWAPAPTVTASSLA